jgi:signal peptidase II
MKMKLFMIIAPVVLVLDQWTKQWIIDHFQLGQSLEVLENFFQLTYVRNKGAAFGFLANAPEQFREPFFMVIPLLASIVFLRLFRELKVGDKLMLWALCLASGGAAGNVVDRLRHGFVVDFLDFHWFHRAHFPAFNVADSAICIGMALFMLDGLLRRPEKKDH